MAWTLARYLWRISRIFHKHTNSVRGNESREGECRWCRLKVALSFVALHQVITHSDRPYHMYIVHITHIYNPSHPRTPSHSHNISSPQQKHTPNQIQSSDKSQHPHPPHHQPHPRILRRLDNQNSPTLPRSRCRQVRPLRIDRAAVRPSIYLRRLLVVRRLNVPSSSIYSRRGGGRRLVLGRRLVGILAGRPAGACVTTRAAGDLLARPGARVAFGTAATVLSAGACGAIVEGVKLTSPSRLCCRNFEGSSPGRLSIARVCMLRSLLHRRLGR